MSLSISWSEVKWSEVTQSCPTLCNPVDCSPPGSSVPGILQARILEWVAISFSRGSSQPRDQTQVSCIAGRHFNLWATREACLYIYRHTEMQVHAWMYAWMYMHVLVQKVPFSCKFFQILPIHFMSSPFQFLLFKLLILCTEYYLSKIL